MAAKKTPKSHTSNTSNTAKKDPTTQGMKQKSPSMDADAFLRQDHRQVESLFERYKATDSSEEKASLAQEICRELIVHTQLEEELFYPACRDKGVEHDALDEAQVEHDGAKIMIGELLAGSPSDDYYDAKLTVLAEYIKHHVREEEKSDGIFAKAKAAGVDMSALGQRIQARKEQLVQKAQGESLRSPEPRSLSLQDGQSKRGGNNMSRQYEQGRDERGQYQDEGDRSYSRGRSSDENNGRRGRESDDRYDNGRFTGSQNHGGNGPDRDDQGRFTANRGGGNRDRNEDERYSRQDYGRSDYRDDDSRGRGWSGDPQGHSDAAMRGWEHRGGSRHQDEGRSYSRSSSDRYQGNNDNDRSRGSGQGWYGDSRGHAEAAERGWESRRGNDDEGSQRSSGRSSMNRSRDDDENGGRSYNRSRDDDDNRSDRRGQGGQGGWFGDSEGHAQAARRGWRDR